MLLETVTVTLALKFFFCPWYVLLSTRICVPSMLKKVPIKKFVHYTIILSLEYGAGVRSNLSLFSFSKLAAVHSNQDFIKHWEFF